MEEAAPLTKYDMEKLKSEVFWDYQITKENLIKMARSDDLRERKHLFEKILFNSTERVKILGALFNQEDLEDLFNSINFDRFNRHNRINYEVARYFLLDEKKPVDGLAWKKL